MYELWWGGGKFQEGIDAAWRTIMPSPIQSAFLHGPPVELVPMTAESEGQIDSQRLYLLVDATICYAYARFNYHSSSTAFFDKDKLTPFLMWCVTKMKALLMLETTKPKPERMVAYCTQWH